MQKDPLLLPSERSALTRHLDSVHAAFVEIMLRLEPDAWNARSLHYGWSPSEIVEHSLLVETGILDSVRRHLGDPTTPNWSDLLMRQEGAIRSFLPRGGKAKASEKNSTFQGFGQEEARVALGSAGAAFDKLLADNEELPLKAIVWPHSMFGSLSAYLWLLYIPLHSERHLHQLRVAAQE